MSLVANADGSRTVHQETGATVTFVPSGSKWVAPARMNASLVENSDGSWTMTRNRFEQFGFDPAGKLQSITDLNGYETALVYDGAGLLDYVEEPGGRRLTFTWTAGRVSSITDPMANPTGPRTVDFVYDTAGDLVGYTDVGGGNWVMTYDSSHQILTARTPRHTDPGDVIENHYGTQGRVDWQEDALDRRTEFHYDDPVANATRIVFPDGDERVDFYDAMGRRIKVTSGYGTPSATSMDYVYDQDTMMVSSVTDGNQETWTYRYDDPANPWSRTSVEDPDGNTTTVVYNTLGLPTTFTAPDFTVNTTSFDATGNMTGATVAAGTADEASVSFVHGDPAFPGDVTAIVDARAKQWDYTYDSVTGMATSVTDPLGATSTFTVNELGWVTATVSPEGNQVGADPDDYLTVIDHNQYGDVVSVENPNGDATTTVYDENRNVVSVTDPEGDVTHVDYTDADQVASRTVGYGTAEAATTTYMYRLDGSLESWTNPAGSTWAYSYDAAGRVASMTDPNLQVTSYSYDNNANLIEVTQPDGDCDSNPKVGCVTYSYDSVNRPAGVEYSDPATPDVTNYTYDDNSRRTAVALSNGDTESWNWTSRGQLDSHTDNHDNTVDYSYDPAGNLTSIRYPDTPDPVVYTFDDVGRMATVTDWLSNTTNFNYDANSNLIDTALGNGATDTYTYDPADQLATIDWANTTGTFADIDYTRTADGNVATAATTGLPTGPTSFGYDHRNQLTTLDTIATYEYDPAGTLTQRGDGTIQVTDPAQQLCWTTPATPASTDCATPPLNATVYDYDNRGNRTQTDAPDGTTATYDYDQANQLTQAAVADRTGSQYKPVATTGVVDTRAATRAGACPTSTGQCVGLSASNGHVRIVQVAGVGPLPAATEIEAVMVNVTALNTTATCTGCTDSISVYPADMSTPPDGVVHFETGDWASTSVLVALDSSGRLAIYSPATVDLVIQVDGYFTTSHNDPTRNELTAVDPVRATDGTSTGDCQPVACSRLGANSTPLYRDIKVTGIGDVPASDVTAVAATITTLNPTADGFLAAHTTGTTPTWLMPFVAGTGLVSNFAVIPVDANGRITVTSFWTQVNVSVDINGYFTGTTNDPATTGFHPITGPTRIMHAVTGEPAQGQCPTSSDPCVPFSAYTTQTVAVTGQGALPDTDIDAVIAQITVTGDNYGFVSAWPDDASPWSGSISVAYNPNDTATGTMTIPVGPTGNINVLAWTNADITIDIVGYLSSTDTINYTYDSDGLRATKASSHTGDHNYTWNQAGGLPLLLTESSEAGNTHLIYGPAGMPLTQINPDNTTWWYHHDHLGSTRALTNNNGEVAGTYTYDAYGKLDTQTGNINPLLDYASQYTDNETGHQYLRARYYDPNTGQFLTRDPLVGVTQDPYGYANNDPVNTVDPNGLWGIKIGPVKVGDGCPLGTNPNGSCRGSNIKNDIATVGVVAGVVAITISTGGLGGVAIAGTFLGTVGTVATAVSAGTAIAVAYDDCRQGTTGACFVSSASAVASTVGGGLSVKGAALAGAASDWALLGDPMRVMGDALFGGWGLGLGIPGLFGYPRSTADC